MALMGLDIGTTGAKATIFDEQERLCHMPIRNMM